MKHKNILLVVFFLTLFVFQQAQAGTTPPLENPSQINAVSPNTNILFSAVQVYVYKLVDGSGALLPSHERCAWPDHFGEYGCGDDFPPGTLEPEGFLIVNVEQDYLRDVLATEMNLAQIVPDPEGQALKAQAVASRSVASWKSANGPWDNGFGEPYGGWPRINNSNTYQVFIPGAHNTSDYKSAIDVAVDGTSAQFLQYVIGDNHVIDASFAADMLNAETVDGDVSAPYLKGIQDPISTGCVLDLGNAQYGMSQRGAIRWAKGQTCPEGTNVDWPASGTTSPVKWDYKQILAHYYTGVDFIDDNTGAKVAPDDRWNLLKYELPNGATATFGTDFTVKVTLQNTSSATVPDWGDMELGYRWVSPAFTSDWQLATIGTGNTIPPLPKAENPPSTLGQSTEFTVAITPPSTGGTYTLHLDVRRHVDGQDMNAGWFSLADWPDAQIAVTVNGGGTICTHWDLASDFRPSPNQENPNRDSCGNLGVWEFLTSSGLTRDPLTYSLATYFTQNFQNTPGVNVWSGIPSYSWPFIGYNENYMPHLWPLHTIQAHPSNTQLAIIAWKSPTNGYVSVTGEVIDTHTESGCGNGIEWYIDKGATNLAYGGFENGGRQFLVGGTNGTNLNAVPVNIDQRLYLIIAPKGVDHCDTTQVNLFIDTTSAPATPTPLNGPTSTPFPPNYTPPPTTPAISTATPPPPTVVSTLPPACSGNCATTCLLYLIQSLTMPGANHMASLYAMPSIQQAAFDIQLLYRVEDEILGQTTEGQHYIDLYYEHGTEISEILANNVEVRNEAVAVLQLWEPNLQALVDGQGGSVTITSGQVQTVQTFLDHLYAVGSPELRQTIDSERALKPLEQTIGLPMNQASAYLVDNQGPPTATPTITFTPTATPTFTPTVQSPISIDIPITSGSDDAEESASGSVSLSSSDLELVRDANDQQVGLRFTNITIPQGATILNAYVQFTVDETTSEATELTIQAEANDNPVTFGYSTSNKVSTRPRTASSVSWSPAAWPTLNANGIDQRTPDLSPILQEVVNRSGWNSGNSLALLVTGTGKRVAVAYEGGAISAPQLHVEYTTSSDPTNTPTSTFTPAPTNTPTNIPTNTPIPGSIFGDGFESGDLSAWSGSSTDGGDLFVSAQAAAVGSYGLEAFIDDTIDLDVTDTTPNNETHYRARFYLNPNSVNLPNNESMYVFTGSDDAYNWKLCLGMRRMAEYYALTLCGQNDANTWFEGKSVYITDDWQAVEIEWQAASAVGANDGYAKLWINDVLVDTLAGLDTDASQISRISLGASDSIPAGSSGSAYFDAFESHQGDPIGLDPNGPTLSAPLTDLVFKDDFESGDFSLWSSTSLDGGDLSVSSPAALFGSYGMQAVINDTASMNATDSSPADEAEYHARFYLDPNSISIPDNNGFSIFSAGGDAGSVFRVTLNNSGGSYTLQTQATHDAGGTVSGQPIVITDEPQLIEVAFHAASADGAKDGYLELWLNDVLVNTIVGMDNDARLVDYVNLGATSGVDTGTSGTIYFDQFESRRNTFIGSYP